MITTPFVPYSILCTSRKDGDGKALAKELRGRLKELLSSGATLKSCRYLSDGDIRITMSVPAGMVQSITDTVYTSESVLEIDIMEAGPD